MLAWMTSAAAQGNTRMERASLRPWKDWLRTMAAMKPSSVLMPTTETTQ